MNGIRFRQASKTSYPETPKGDQTLLDDQVRTQYGVYCWNGIYSR